MRRAALLLPTFLMGCGATASSLEPTAASPDPEAPAVPLRVERLHANLEVHGGDGDGIPAIWWLQCSADATNDTDAPMHLTTVEWTLGELTLVAHATLDRTLAPGDSVPLDAQRYLTLDELRALRAWRDAGHSTTAARVVVGVQSQSDADTLTVDGTVEINVW